MKRLLFCLVALIATLAMVVPTYAMQMNINGISRVKFISVDNMNGTDDVDDNRNFVKQRLRMYFTSIASENLKAVYKNEIDFEWGDAAFTNARGQGGARGGDTVNLETKNVYLEFMVPDTPVKATVGLQGMTLHKGWFMADDIAAARFDLNFDPVSVLAYWAINTDTDFTSSSDDRWQLVASGAYKAENMDARLSFGYERRPNDTTTADDPKDNDFYILMGELNMSFDLASFFVIAGVNFGEADGDGAPRADNRDYEGYMFHAGVDIALDMATLRGQFIYTSGDDEGDFDKDWEMLDGRTFSWAEIPSDGYFWEANSSMSQIGGENSPSNMWAGNVGASLKPTDTTTIALDLWYIGMVEKRTVGGDEEDEIGTEIEAKVTQKVYDNLDVLVIGAYMFADKGYGSDTSNSDGDDAYVVGLGMNYKF